MDRKKLSPNSKRRLGFYFTAFALLFLMKGCWMEWLERQLVFFPSYVLEATPAQFGLSFEDLTLRTSDGIDLNAWFVPSPTEKVRMIFFHGNGGNIGSRVHLLADFTERGISVLLVDYRGYGKSKGAPSELGIYADAEAALAWVKNREPKGVPIVYYGESLGSAVAVELAASKELPHKLILEGAFTSARDMAKVMYSFLGEAIPLTYRFDNIGKIPKISCPLLSIHAMEDDVVPYELGVKLHEAHRGPKEFYAVPRAHHNDLVYTAGAGYFERIAEFILKAY